METKRERFARKYGPRVGNRPIRRELLGPQHYEWEMVGTRRGFQSERNHITSVTASTKHGKNIKRTGRVP